MKSIALYSLKGGVGKTTVAAHLAHLSSRSGRATLLWDLDAQGAASWIFRVRMNESSRPKRWLHEPANLLQAIRGSDWPGLDVLPADLTLAAFERDLRDVKSPAATLGVVLSDLGLHYERVFLDCPPAFSPLVRGVLDAVDAVAVPTIPTPLALRTLATLYPELKPARSRGLRVLPFFSMVDGRKSIQRQVRAFVRAENLGFLATEIPLAARIEGVAVQRRPLTDDSTDDSSAPFVALHREIEERLADECETKLGRGRIAAFLQELGQAP